MRTYVAVAALALTAVACGGTSTQRVAHVANDLGFDPPDAARRTTVTVPVHDHSTHSHAVRAKPAPFAAPAPAPAPPGPLAPRKTPRYVSYGRFHTPEAAMRYLARAYNSHDDAALRRVTDLSARDQMIQMRPYAPDLQLTKCEDSGMGNYTCYFSHAMPPSMKTTHRGSAEVTVSPALKPGWYMSSLVDCGD